MFLPVPDARAEPVETCVRQAKVALFQVRSFASQCGAQERDLASIDAGVFPSSPKPCSAPIVVSSQQEAFSECARLYQCAKAALDCVVETVRASGTCDPQDTGVSCACMQRHPIPAQ